MKIYAIVLKFIFYGLFLYLFNLKKNFKLYLITYQLLNKFSYRIPECFNYDRLVFLRELKYILKSLFDYKNTAFLYNKDGDRIILEGGNSFITNEKKYVEYHHKHIVLHSYISKDNIVSYNFSNFLDKSFFIFFTILTSLPLFVITFFSKKRARISLLFREIIENILLIKYLVKNKIMFVYDFIPYEKDGNFLSYCLKDLGISIFKIPSLGPLLTHNKHILADVLITSSEYHLEEINIYKDSFFVSTYEKWLPEHSLDYIAKYTMTRILNDTFEIGYYSHACWLRNKEGNSKSLLFSYIDEIELLKILNKYSASNNKKIIVFPHPKELTASNRLKAIEFYENYLGNNFIFFEDGKTSENFHKVDVAISTYSTVIFERLFMGYKSIFFTKSLTNFPLVNSVLNNICAKSKDDLLFKIDDFLKQSKKDFFEKNKMNNYVFKILT